MRRWFLRYRKILLLSLAAVVVLSAVLYLRPRPFTSVYDDIDWGVVGDDDACYRFLSVAVYPAVRETWYFEIPPEPLQEIMVGTNIRRSIPSHYRFDEESVSFSLPIGEEESLLWIRISDVGYISCKTNDEKNWETWVITGGEPFARLYDLMEHGEKKSPKEQMEEWAEEAA